MTTTIKSLYLLLFAVFSFSCAGAACQRGDVRNDPPDLSQIAGKVVIDCNGDGVFEIMGSGTYVGPDLVLTARHVVEHCHSITAGTFFLVGDKMQQVTKITLSQDADLALMTMKEKTSKWATVGDTFERETIYSYTSADQLYCTYKSGYVSALQDGVMIVSLHAVPGNSGSGIFNKYGTLVGTLTRAAWDPSNEFLGLAYTKKTMIDFITKRY